jgi:hypothetical protein
MHVSHFLSSLLGRISLSRLSLPRRLPLLFPFLAKLFTDPPTQNTPAPNAATSTPPRGTSASSQVASCHLPHGTERRAQVSRRPPLSPSPHSPPCPSPLRRRHPQNPRPALCGSGRRWRAGARTTMRMTGKRWRWIRSLRRRIGSSNIIGFAVGR